MQVRAHRTGAGIPSGVEFRQREIVCVFLSLSRSSASSAKRFLLLFRSLASVATFRWRGKVAKGDLCTFGAEVSETFLVSCLGCNFARMREVAKGFYVLFSPCREKSTKRAPLGERPLRSFPKSPIYAVSTARTQGPPIVRKG